MINGVVVGMARCAVRAPFEGRNVCMTCTCGAIGSARSDAGGDIAARCPYPLNTYAGTAGEAPRILAVIALSLGSFLLPLLLLFFLGRRGEQ